MTPKSSCSDGSATSRHYKSSADATPPQPPGLSRGGAPGQSTEPETLPSRPAAPSKPPRTSPSSLRQEQAILPRGIQPATTISLTVPPIEILPSKNIIIPAPHPPPPKDFATMYLVVYERDSKHDRSFNPRSTAKRDCCILVQRDAHIHNYTEYFSDSTSSSGRHMQLNMIPNLPDPRTNSPGLLGMHFIAWIPHGRVREIDQAINKVDSHWSPSLSFKQNSWIQKFLWEIAGASLISFPQVERTLSNLRQTVRMPRRTAFPNQHRCFPSLGRETTSSSGAV